MLQKRAATWLTGFCPRYSVATHHRLSEPSNILVVCLIALFAVAPSAAHAAVGVTDWLNVHDYGDNIQAAIDATGTSSSRVVYVPAGTYEVSGPILFPNNKSIRLLGAGPGLSTLQWVSPPAGDYITIRFSGQVLENITVVGTGSGSGSGLVVDPTSAPSGVLAGCEVRGCTFNNILGWGIKALGNGTLLSNDCRVDRCALGGGGNGIKIGTGCTAWSLREVNVNGTTGPMLQLDSAAVIHVDRGLFGPSSAGTQPYIKITNTTNVLFTNCDIESDLSSQFFVSLNGGLNESIMLVDCGFRRDQPFARLIQCTGGANVGSLCVINPSVYLNVQHADSTRTDDIVVDAPSTASIMGGLLGDNSAFVPLRISGTATGVFLANYNDRVRLPKLSTAQRDQLKDRSFGDVVYNGDRLNHWDGARWREEVAFFPSGSTANAGPGGIDLPSLTTAGRDSIPATFKTPGAFIYNSTTGQLNYWNGSVWKAVTAR